jgi:nitrite reductase/ring-hydroxylating ferredoxin subunit
MLTPQDNERLTRVGAGTPMGNLYRRYWLPAAISSALPENDGAPLRVRLLGEDLIAFRDSNGDVGLVGAFCPHRRAPMFFGRNEECGLRCVYHGWKFDRAGECVDMPSEPPDSLFKTKVRIESYPVWEGGGIVWTYMGPPELQPAPPDFEFVRAPATHAYVTRTVEDCNYLQALEGGLDSTHISFLHKQNAGDVTYLHDYESTVPRIDVEVTDYGYMYIGIRHLPESQWVRGYQYVMPAVQMRDGFGGGNRRGETPKISGHYWVPIDDAATMVYNFRYSYDPADPLTLDDAVAYETIAGRGPGDLLPDFRLKKNRTNDYGIDRALQKTGNFTGIVGVNTQDYALQEGMGPIVDRSQEHLGTTDRAIIVMRQLLLEATYAVERGEAPRGIDPSTYRSVRSFDRNIPRESSWQTTIAAEATARY